MSATANRIIDPYLTKAAQPVFPTSLVYKLDGCFYLDVADVENGRLRERTFVLAGEGVPVDKRFRTARLAIVQLKGYQRTVQGAVQIQRLETLVYHLLGSLSALRCSAQAHAERSARDTSELDKILASAETAEQEANAELQRLGRAMGTGSRKAPR